MREFFKFKSVFTTRNIAIIGMMLALKSILSMFNIWVGDLKLFTAGYIPGLVVSILFGPWVALLYGFIADIIGYLSNSGGQMYFAGYAISEMVTYFIYACFFYKAKDNNTSLIIRAVLSRICILFIVILGLNFLWQSIIYGSQVSVFFNKTRLISNIIQFPLYVAVTTVTAKFTLKVNNNIVKID